MQACSGVAPIPPGTWEKCALLSVPVLSESDLRRISQTLRKKSFGPELSLGMPILSSYVNKLKFCFPQT